MFKPNYSTCVKCDRERLIVVKKGYCKQCNEKSKSKKIVSIPLVKSSTSKNVRLNVAKKILSKFKYKKATGERQVHLQIWKERKHQCINCLIWLGNYPHPHFFAHLIRKSQRPDLRLEPDNFILLCMECHQQMDQGTKEGFEKRKNLYKKINATCNEETD